MRKVETALTAVPGVISARVNLSAKRATVVFGKGQVPDASKLIDALGAIGFRAAELAPETVETAQDDGRRLLSRLAVAGFAAMNIMLFSVSVWAGSGTGRYDAHAIPLDFRDYRGASRGLCRAAVFQLRAWEALKRWRVNMDVPISLAIPSPRR